MATAYRFGDSYCYVIVFIVIFIVAAVLIILIVGLLLWMRLWCVIALPLPTIFLVTPHLVSLPPTPLGVLPRIYHNGRREGDDFGFWREQKTDEKLWRGVEVYRQVSLLEIGRRVKCKISF